MQRGVDRRRVNEARWVVARSLAASAARRLASVAGDNRPPRRAPVINSNDSQAPCNDAIKLMG